MPPAPLHTDDLARSRAITRGDDAAFRAFFDEAFPRLFRFVLRHTRDAALAEELTQDALVIALEKMSGYRGESSLLTWLFGIARHRMQRQDLADARLARFEDDDGLDAVLASLLPTDAHGPDQLAARDEAIVRVHSVLDRLPPLYSECLEAKYVLGMSVRELAQRQQRSEKSVESTLTRAREAFRDAFLCGMQPEAGR